MPISPTPARKQAITTVTQWLACAHDGTSLLPAGPDPCGVGVVAVAGQDAPDPGNPPPGGTPVAPAGLVIGADCRAYHSIPERGSLDVLVWHPETGRTDAAGAPLFADGLLTVDPVQAGEFHSTGAPPTAMRIAALAVVPAPSAHARHLVAVGDDGEVVQFDVHERRTVRRVRLTAPVQPGAPWTAPSAGTPELTVVDVAAGPDEVYLACSSRAHPLWRMGWHSEPVEVAVAPRSLVGLPAGAVPARVAADPAGRVWLLWQAAGQPSWATPVADPRTSVACGPFADASDLELDGDGNLVVAALAGADLRTISFVDGAPTENRPLRARRADGRGIARTPDGRIAYWTEGGVRVAHGAPLRYRAEGTVVTTALDGAMFRQRWGRLFLDACLPPGTSVSVAFLSSDDLPGDELDGMAPPLGTSVTIAASPPVNVTPAAPVSAAPIGLPLPAADAPGIFGPDLPVYRRGAVEQPWLQPTPGDPFVTYEAPVNAAPGRYLWLRIRLQATGLRTPRVRAVRVETSGPKLLERLPRVYSEDTTSAAFLDRYLKLLDGPIADLGSAADSRHVLLDPASAPAQLLPWLASLVGLALDPRWPEPARRTMIADAVPLFRRRGTIGALLTMMEIVLGVRPVLVERFAFRGLTGQVGHTLIRAGTVFADYAHRFSVVIPGAPSAEQLAMITDLLTVHRPAHTLFEICSASTGSRIGIGLHLGLTSVVGRSSGWSELAVGGVLGRDAVLGRPDSGLRVGSGAVGQDARVEP